ncbi:MAG TPA: hypothetical protein VF765_36795 [Polyangiaceae bacterium]
MASRRALVSAAFVMPVLVVACGSRGPLDIEVIREVPDSGASADVVLDVPAETTDVASHDALADVVDAEPEAMGPDAGPIPACVQCLTQSCGQQLITCVTSTGCRTALQCVVQMCLTGGTPDIQCLGNCTGSDPATQQQVLTVIGCIIGCPQCTGALGGLGGGGGGGGGGGAGG